MENHQSWWVFTRRDQLVTYHGKVMAEVDYKAVVQAVRSFRISANGAYVVRDCSPDQSNLTNDELQAVEERGKRGLA